MKKLTKKIFGVCPIVAISPILTSCACLPFRWAISDEDMIDKPKPNPESPVKPETEETKAEPESEEGYIVYDTTLLSNKRPFLKDNNLYYFKDLKYEEQLYPEEHFERDDLYKDIDMYPSILISWNEKTDDEVDLLEENESIKHLMKMDPESPYKINNANRQFLNLDYKLKPGRYYGYMNYMTKYLNGGTTIKDSKKDKTETHEEVVKKTYINSYRYKAKEFPVSYLMNYWELKGNDWWTKAPYQDYGNNNLARVNNTEWGRFNSLESIVYFLPFTRSKHGFYSIYKEAVEHTYYDVLEDFIGSGKQKIWVHNDLFINACAGGARTIHLSDDYNHLYRRYFSLLKTINDGHHSKIFEPFSSIKNLDDVKEKLNFLVDSCASLLSWNKLLGEEVESYKNKNKTHVKMFPNFELSQITDFEYSYIFTYELLHEAVLPLMCCLKMDLPISYNDYERTLVNEETKPIYEYLYLYMNELFKNKICPFNNKKYPELKLITGVKEKFEDEKYQEVALEKALKFIKIWSDRLQLGFDTETF